jgi:DNA-nicking Smr family endonuclease
VRRLLASRADVAECFDAPPERGGTGATIVLLRS